MNPSLRFFSGHNTGLFQIPPEEKGQVETRPRPGGGRRAGHGQLRGAGSAHRQGEPRDRAGDASGRGRGAEDGRGDGRGGQGFRHRPMQLGQEGKYGK